MPGLSDVGDLTQSGAFQNGTRTHGSDDRAQCIAPLQELGCGWRMGILGHMNNKTGFELRDADYQRRVRESFARQGLMAHLGAELVSLEPGGVVIRVPFRGGVDAAAWIFSCRSDRGDCGQCLRVCGVYVDGGRGFGADGGVQDEFAGAGGWGGVGGAGACGAVWEDVEGLHGGCVCAEGRSGEPLRDGVGDDYVHGG
jgi:hypothetical protein